MDIFATSGKDKWHREAEANSFLMEPANPIYDADEARSNSRRANRSQNLLSYNLKKGSITV